VRVSPKVRRSTVHRAAQRRRGFLEIVAREQGRAARAEMLLCVGIVLSRAACTFEMRKRRRLVAQGR
jgi:hypothetical protein